MKKTLQRFFRNEHGIALIEFAIVVPVMLTLVFCSIEYGRYILIAQKIGKSAYQIASITSQYPPVSNIIPAPTAEISGPNLDNQVLTLFDRLMAPFNDPAREMVVISSIVHKDHRDATPTPQQTANFLQWQRFTGGITSAPADSISIITGTAPANSERTCQDISQQMPQDIATLIDGAYQDENIIVAEVAYRYEPILSHLVGSFGGNSAVLGPRTIRQTIFIHPRSGELWQLSRPLVTPGQCIY